MKVLHVAFSFPPDPPGGTELYVQALSRELLPLGVQSVVAAPGPEDRAYEIEGLPVRRFATGGDGLALEDLYGVDSAAAAAFDRILDAERPDLLHQHALTSACSGQLIVSAKRRGLPVVFTYHTPTVSCQRGSLLEWGRRPCDGHVSVSRCTPCTLHGLGLDGTASQILARTPELAGNIIGRVGLAGGAWTALRMRNLMRRRTDHLAQVLAQTDVFIALTPWVRALLQANGVPESRIVDCAHGVFGKPAAGVQKTKPPLATDAARPLRIAHLGRLDPGKGTRLLVEAVRAVPDAHLLLDVFGIVQNAGDAGRMDDLHALAAGDARVRFVPPVPQADVIQTLVGYDLVAVPSQWFETGPLVIVEAFAAGVPVVGSALGGITDKVTHGRNGWLVKPYDSVSAWSAMLSRLAADGYLMTRMRSGVQPPRTMAEVAREIAAIYRAHGPKRRAGLGRAGHAPQAAAAPADAPRIGR